VTPQRNAAATACLLALTTLCVAPPAAAQLLGSRIEAGCAGVATGGSISNTTITSVCGIPPEVLEALVRDRTKPLQDLADTQKVTIVLLQDKLQLNERQIRAALDVAGEADVPLERIAQRLIEITGRYKELITQVRASPGDDPHVAELKSEAGRALEAGDLNRAKMLLLEVRKAQTADFDRRALDLAATDAQLGGIALTRLQYQEAADYFAAAAGHVPSGHAEQRLAYLDKEADALYHQGDEFGDNMALVAAIERYRAALEEQTRERVPLNWARTQTNLGIVLAILGERESDTARLEQAVGAFRAALEEQTRERVPLDWAMAQVNLGNALQTLGRREPGTARLEEAVAAYRLALEEHTRERVPLDWAMTQVNLGNALASLGKHETGMAWLEEAVSAYTAAIEVFKAAGADYYLEVAQDNLNEAKQALHARQGR
jgi:tetratricopeptide (TPR) repeat protein